MTESTRDHRIKDLLMDVLDCDPAQRDSFAQSTIEDPALRREVLELIDAHERAGEFMHDPSSGLGLPSSGADSSPAFPFEEPGSIIGRYKLLRLIGEGGFGRVYLAEQFEPVVRRVALKIIKLGMDTREVIARFEAERQALAMMDHPGIARVLDAGAAASGRPYFVMELVRGVPITAYCDDHRLNIEQRLDLFSQVCEAVQHAHMKGIIHRDLKPGNILVSSRDEDTERRRDGVGSDRDATPNTSSVRYSVSESLSESLARPKIIDFGIAKAVSGRLTDKTLFTEHRQLIGTPEYMSPEQVEPDASDIDTRVDVYSLGVVLYELLTGSTPLDVALLRSASYDEMQRMIREQEPEKPSTRLSTLHARPEIATRRDIEPSRAASQLRGDLDWITLKAMEKTRDRRYSSPSELADDIRRHLRHEPVRACPPSRMDRVRKFVRRHRVGVALASLTALMFVVGASIVIASLLHARDADQQTLQISDFMTAMFTSVDPDRGRGADVRLVEVLKSASDAASQRFATHPELEAQVHDRLGEAYDHLALFPQSVPERLHAMNLSDSVFGPDDPRSLQRRVLYIQALANSGHDGQVPPLLDGLAQRIERDLGPNHALWFAVQQIHGVEMSRQRQFAQSESFLNGLAQRAAGAAADEHVQTALSNALVRVLARELGDAPPSERPAVAARMESAAQQLVDRSARLLGPDATPTLEDRMMLAQALVGLGRYEAAREMCDAVLEASKTRLGECHTVCKLARLVLSAALMHLDRTAEAADVQLRTIECARLDPPIVLVSDMMDAIPVLDRGGRWVEGERVARELAQQLPALGGGHGPTTLDAELAVARFVALQGRLDEADQLFGKLLPREEEARADAHVLARMHMFYGAHLVQRGRYDDAERQLQTAASAIDDIRHGTSNSVPDDLIVEFIALYSAWNKPDKVTGYERLQYEALHSGESSTTSDP